MSTGTLALLTSTPEQVLQQWLAAAALPDLPVDQLKILDVQAVSGTLTQLTVALELVPAALDDWEYAGEAILEYNRIDLANLFSGINLQFNPPSYPTTVDWVCQHIAAIGNILFDPVDFVRESITQEMAVEYTLIANPKSLRFVGQVPVSLFTQVQLGSFFVPYGGGSPLSDMGDLHSVTANLGIGIYSQNTNATVFAPRLARLAVGYVFTTTGPVLKWNLFNRVLNQSGSPWIIDHTGSKPYNGNNATVTYNGPIDPTVDMPYNSRLGYVCRIQLDPTYCLNWSGTLNIYYSKIHMETT